MSRFLGCELDMAGARRRLSALDDVCYCFYTTWHDEAAEWELILERHISSADALVILGTFWKAHWAVKLDESLRIQNCQGQQWRAKGQGRVFGERKLCMKTSQPLVRLPIVIGRSHCGGDCYQLVCAGKRVCYPRHPLILLALE